MEITIEHSIDGAKECIIGSDVDKGKVLKLLLLRGPKV